MIILRRILFTTVALLFMTVLAQADTIVDPNAGFLNDIIDADVLPSGERADSVYIFKRGETYFYDSQLKNYGYPLTLKAEEGDGPLPILRTWPREDGQLKQFMETKDDVYLYNLYIDGMGPDLATTEPDPLYRMSSIMIEATAAGKVVVIDGCILNNSGQVHVRSSDGARLVKVTNTVFANMGQISRDNIGNGRGFDFRDGGTDTVIVRNCTFVNNSDRFLRHVDNNGKNNFIQYLEIDHCTFVHQLGAFGVMQFGDLGEAGVKLTNNLFLNPMTLGYRAGDPWRSGDFQLPNEFDENGDPIMQMFSDEANEGVNVNFEIHNNLMYTDPEIIAYIETKGAVKAPVFTQRITDALGENADKAYVEEPFTLTNIPEYMWDLTTWYYENPPEQGASTTDEYDFDRKSITFWLDSLDCSFSTDSRNFIGSDGLPIGDTNWNSVVTASAGTIVDPNAGFLNDIIDADVLPSGERADSVYIFKRGETYFYDSQLKNYGYPLTLKAEEGDGPLPILRTWPREDGQLKQFMETKDDVYLYNLYIDGMGPDLATTEPDPLYRMSSIMIEATAAGKVVVIDGCILNNSGQVHVRSSDGARLVKVTNTVFANMGQISRDNIGNGRGFDFRDGGTDTVIVRNCTFVNNSDRFLRHVDNNGKNNFIQYLEIDHCTFVHQLGAFGVMQFGDLGEAGVKLTNNLFLNPMTLGYRAGDPWRSGDFQLPNEFDENGDPIMQMFSDEANEGVNVNFEIHNNLMYTDPEIIAYIETKGAVKAPVFTQRITDALGENADKAYVEEPFTLTNIPEYMWDLTTWYYENPPEQGASTTDEYDFDRKSITFWLDSLDCSFSTDSRNFIGSDGLPIGDTNWNSIITAVSERLSGAPAEFSLVQNYPNPFNPSTVINYSLQKPATVELFIYDMLGRRVADLVNKKQTAGTYSVNWNAADDDGNPLAAGIYFYKLQTESFSQVKKMILVK